ncbi:GNAT family N-acetyltransferase [Nocardia flavorosea]|uniref:GNAT family N-acetyltransferase n=1 Tax=Nocardia flavorosea TaxID=53429 RepID=UPI0018962A60|nr:GNAT family N-acetyltransferase [Nocardia flavorosea]MBF6351305.1 GNAT family N-acetyltransferase [Nocardia flavorosea]
MIREATATDIPRLQEIEVRAGEPFAAVGMDAVAGDEPLSAAVLGEFVLDGRAWAWVSGGVAVGYLIVSVVDGNAHIDQVSVLPEYRGQRIGRRLIDRAVRWAAERGLPAITLTTFVEVEWNGPYYERLGFRYLDEAAETPGLRATRAAEIAHGLDRWPRACMTASVPEWGYAAPHSE